MRVFRAVLPLPPSVNHMYAPRCGGGKFLTPEAVQFFADVERICAGWVEPFACPLHLSMFFYLENFKKRDLDNVRKCVFDGLQKGGIFYDDAQIVVDFGQKMPPDGKGGRIVVSVEEAFLAAWAGHEKKLLPVKNRA